jgi:nitrate reductase NapE component
MTKFAIHLTLLPVLTALLALGISYPFLSGDYDRLAIPMSTIIQVFGVVGLTLVPVGIFWLVKPRYRFGFAITALIVSTFVILVICLFATLSVGKSLGALILLVWTFIVIFLIPKIKSLKEQTQSKANWLPVYLIYLPIFTLLFQLTLAKYLAQLSRDRAIENAERFIRHIEEYHTQQGQYPLTLQAQNKDYYPDVVGVEKYLYAPHRKGYNLSFEQPRFLLDKFGTREWVVYNPLDENSVYSHTAWLLPTEQAEPSQGWYASGNTGHQHWKYFLFD